MDADQKKETVPEKHTVCFIDNLQLEPTFGAQRPKLTPDCSNLYPTCASHPFTPQTHVLSGKNPPSQEVDVSVEDTAETQVLDEQGILALIHGPEIVPGVIEDAHYDETDERSRKLGLTFRKIPTLRKMLETSFDLLEVLRFLRFHRNILHRKINKQNVLYFEDPPSSPMPDAQRPLEAKGTVTAAKEMPLCFIKYLLRESDDPRKTSMHLVNFDNAEHIESELNVEHKQVEQTIGTRIFVARAVEQGEPVSLPDYISPMIPAVPDSPDAYTPIHQDRIRKFPPTEGQVLTWESALDPPWSQSRQWRHELDHDAESVFWLLLYWATVGQPLDCPDEDISLASWSYLLGETVARCSLILSMASRIEMSRDLTHSFYDSEPLGTLIHELATILVVDRHWLPESDVRNDPGYITEAFQRLILKFVLDNQDQEFMDRRIDTVVRRVEKLRFLPPLRSGYNVLRPADDGEETASSSTDDRMKRRRLCM